MKKIKKVSERKITKVMKTQRLLKKFAMPKTKMEMLKAMYHEMEQMKAKRPQDANFGKIMSAMHPEGIIRK